MLFRSALFVLLSVFSFIALAGPTPPQDEIEYIDRSIYDFIDRRVTHNWSNVNFLRDFFMSIRNYGGATDAWALRALTGVKTVSEYKSFGNYVMKNNSWYNTQDPMISFDLIRSYVRRGNMIMRGLEESKRQQVVDLVNKSILPSYHKNPVLTLLSGSKTPDFDQVLGITSVQVTNLQRESCSFKFR